MHFEATQKKLLATKIVFLSATVEYGGVERHIQSLIDFFIDRQFKIHLAILGKDVFTGRLKPRDNLTFSFHPLSSVSAQVSFREALRLLYPLRGGICILEKGTFHTGSLGLELAARIWFRKLITIEQLEADPLPPKTSKTYLGGLIRGRALWWHKLRFRGYLRSLAPHRIICVSDAVRRKLITQYSFPSKKTFTARNGINVDQFRPNAQLRTIIRSAWGLNDRSIVFGAIARFHPVKALDVAIRCFGRLAEQRPELDLHLVLYGKGNEETNLRAIAEQTQTTSRIQFHPFTNEPWVVLNGFDFYVMPSRNEGLPFALLEAMATGVVPIAMNVGGISEIYSDTSVGWLVDAQDEDAFFSAMREAAGLPFVTRMQMANAARKIVIDKFDEKMQFQRIVELIGI